MSPFEERLRAVRERIERAQQRSGRLSAVRLLAVSKSQPAAALRAAYEAGQRDFGENYAQELVQKALELGGLPGLQFHFIGHLQRNKIKDIVGHVAAIQTVDRDELARAIDQRALGPIDVLIEVNLAGEEQKSGCSPAALETLAKAIASCPKLRLRGLMTVPPMVADAELARPYFRRLRELGEALVGQGMLAHGLELSMGMSGDFEVAIEEGATVVRVGTALFGPRPPRAGGV